MGTSLGMMFNEEETCEDEVESRIGLTCRTIEALRKEAKKPLSSGCAVCALIFAEYIFHKFSIFTDFAFLNSWMLAIVPCISIDV